MFRLEDVARPRIWGMKPYSSARDEFSGQASVFLDANENPLLTPYNRYPDTLQGDLKRTISQVLGFSTESIFLGNGSDEAIDLLLRVFCEPNQDEILTLPPTYGMYAVSAEINSVRVKQVPLLADFQVDMQAVWAQITPQTKIIFLCSPNNPTGNVLNSADVFTLLQGFRGIVVIDEAYIDFSAQDSWAGKLEDFPQLVVLRTFSKAWGMAALRIGMALACPRIIALLNKVKPPYNLNVLTQAHLKHTLENNQTLPALVQTIIAERQRLATALQALSIVETVYPSEANFLLVRFRVEAKTIYQALTQKGIVVRDRSTQIGCERCLRITIGTAEENSYLLATLHAL